MKLKKKQVQPDIGLNLEDRDVYERYYVRVVGEADGFYHCSLLFRPTHTLLECAISEKEAIAMVKRFEGMNDAELIEFMVGHHASHGIRAYQQSMELTKQYPSEEEWYAKGWSNGTTKLYTKAKVNRSLVSMPDFKNAYREATRVEVSIGRTTREDETQAPVEEEFTFEIEDGEVETPEPVKPKKVLVKKSIKQEEEVRVKELEKEASRLVRKLLKKKK